MKYLALSEISENYYQGAFDDIEVLVRFHRNKWSYTLLYRSHNGGYGRFGTATKLKEVLYQLAQHLPHLKIFLVINGLKT